MTSGLAEANKTCPDTSACWCGPCCTDALEAARASAKDYANRLEAVVEQLTKSQARVAELEHAIRFLALAAYRDGCTSLVAATALDEALAMVGLPRVDGREPGQAASGSGSSSGSTEKGPGRG
jgi:hypothetical protein